MAYRDKPDLFPDPTPEERREQRYILWIMPMIVVAPNLGRLMRALGLEASQPTMVAATVLMGLGCLAGAVFSYRAARAQTARDLAELTGPRR